MRKLRHRTSTEVNLILHLVENGFNNCNCEIKTLCDKIMLLCTCEGSKEIPSEEESESQEKTKPNNGRRRKSQ